MIVPASNSKSMSKALVLHWSSLPSHGRGGGEDFNYFLKKVSAAAFTALRPPLRHRQLKGNMQDVTLHDLTADIALVIRELGATAIKARP